MSPAFIDLAEGGDTHAAVMAALHTALRGAARDRLTEGPDAGRADLVTVDVHVSFLRPAAGRLAVQGEVTGGGRSVCFCLARLVDTEGVLVAQAMGTFRTPARA